MASVVAPRKRVTSSLRRAGGRGALLACALGASAAGTSGLGALLACALGASATGCREPAVPSEAPHPSSVGGATGSGARVDARGPYADSRPVPEDAGAPGATEPVDYSRMAELLAPAPPREPYAAGPEEVAPAQGRDGALGGPSAWAGPLAAGADRASVVLGAAERRELATALCEGATVTSSARGAECACPSFTPSGGSEPGMDALLITSMYGGHYTAPGRREAVVASLGCEYGASSSQTYGGFTLARWSAGDAGARGWHVVSYRSQAVDDCRPVLSGRGRSALVCHEFAGHMGLYRHQFMWLAWDEHDGVPVETGGDFLQLLTHAQGGQPDGPVYVLDIDRWALRGTAEYAAGNDSALGVDVGVKSRVDCSGPPAGCGGVDRTPFDAQLRFAFDGNTFRVTDASRSDLARVRERNRE